ncbi:MAG: hypothetical protein J7K51_03390 [Thermotogae bacterium]|nr:hypothetical protein [Thermotogota bacterium]
MNEHEKSEITFDIVCEYGKLVETVFVSDEEFETEVGKSAFLLGGSGAWGSRI